MEKNLEKVCAVCGNKYMADIYDQGTCKFCGWNNSYRVSEFSDKVIYPNLISLNKAKKLYSENKPFEPDLNDFVEALYIYSEVQFKYKDLYYEVVLSSMNDDEIIKMNDFNGGHLQTFISKEDFVNNAKIDGEFLKDIWNETTDRYWLQ